MTDHRDLTFHVIFVPGTVRCLSIAILTLLRRSPYRYCLVSNGLDAAEIAALRDLARGQDRLSVYVHPCSRPLPHGALLSLLAWRESGDYVCFADSDIFATAPFASELERRLDECDVFTSCSHFVADPDEQVEGFGGRCLRTPSGATLPATFFAVYRREALIDTMRATGVGFERINFGDQLTDEARAVVTAAGWQGEKIDTAKLLGVMMHDRGYRVVHEELPALLHIGGISWWLLKHESADAGPFVWKDGAFAFLGRRADRKQSREVVAHYFSDYLRSRFGDAPVPRLKIARGEMRDKVESAMRAIDDAYAGMNTGA